MRTRYLLSLAAVIIGTFLFSIGLQAFAFTQPSTSPPNADAYAPLTTSPTAESKAGGLLLNTSGATNGLIVQSGNVGIGVTSPTVSLDVAQNGALCVGQACFSSGGDYAHVANNEWYNGSYWTVTAPGALIQLTGQSTNFYRHDASGNHSFSMTIDPSGNVGIGTWSPLGKLDVEGGNLCLNGSCIGSWPLNTITTVTSGTYLWSASVSCPAGYVVLGGGGSCNNSNTGSRSIDISEPDGQGWYLQCGDIDNNDDYATAYAICAYP